MILFCFNSALNERCSLYFSVRIKVMTITLNYLQLKWNIWQCEAYGVKQPEHVRHKDNTILFIPVKSHHGTDSSATRRHLDIIYKSRCFECLEQFVINSMTFKVGNNSNHDFLCTTEIFSHFCPRNYEEYLDSISCVLFHRILLVSRK